MGRYLNKWNSMCDMEVVPVLEDEEAAVVGKEVLATLGG